MKFLIIGDKDTVTGFSLAGIEGIVANSKREAMRELQQAVNRKGVGIILITEGLARQMQDVINDLLFCTKKCHLILQIPDVQGQPMGPRMVEEFVLSAIGVKI
ncbi:MAG: V-type ATP synthase subunit F [bacterium]